MLTAMGEKTRDVTISTENIPELHNNCTIQYDPLCSMIHCVLCVTRLLLLDGVGDGRASESSQRGGVGGSESRHTAQQKLIQTLGRLALLPHQDHPLLQDVCHTQPCLCLQRAEGGDRSEERYTEEIVNTEHHWKTLGSVLTDRRKTSMKTEWPFWVFSLRLAGDHTQYR